MVDKTQANVSTPTADRKCNKYAFEMYCRINKQFLVEYSELLSNCKVVNYSVFCPVMTVKCMLLRSWCRAYTVQLLQ